MSETKHTPGPWKTSASCRWIVAGTTKVAEVLHQEDGTRPGNAALLAAAMDLYKALDDLKDYGPEHTMDCGGHVSSVQPCFCGAREVGRAARAALAKARGE